MSIVLYTEYTRVRSFGCGMEKHMQLQPLDTTAEQCKQRKSIRKNAPKDKVMSVPPAKSTRF
jgi:hypothetical protein